MARIRSIKPTFFSDEELSNLAPETHLLAAGLICYADDEGFFAANPKLVQAGIFPLRELSLSVQEMLRSLHEIGYIRLGKTPEGKAFGVIVNFTVHQRVSHLTPSVIKDLAINWDDSRNIREASCKPRESFRSELNKELNKEEELEGKGDAPPRFPLRSAPISIPTRAEASDDVCCAAKLWRELGLATSASDVELLATVLKLEREQNPDVNAYEYLLRAARDAIKRGESVNRFFFQDRKFAVKRDMYEAYLTREDSA